VDDGVRKEYLRQREAEVLVLLPAGGGSVQGPPAAVPVRAAVAQRAPIAAVPPVGRRRRRPGVLLVVPTDVVVAVVAVAARAQHGVRHRRGRAGLGPRRQRVEGRRRGRAERVGRGRRRRVHPCQRTTPPVGGAAGPAPVHLVPRRPVRARGLDGAVDTTFLRFSATGESVSLLQGKGCTLGRQSLRAGL
jgi:hypothetical protein